MTATRGSRSSEHGTVVPRALARLPEFAWSGITLSRDGSRVIFAHADRRAANIGVVGGA